MANSDKDILITPGKDTANLPEISFVGLNNAPIQLKVLDDNTISFEGSSGQLFSLTNNLTIGTIFSVNDVSGIPAIETTAEGLNYLSPYYGNTIIGPGSKQLTGIDSTRPAFILNSNGNNTRYDMEVFANHGISDGNYGGITFTQGSSGAYSTQLASIRIEYTNAGYPHIGFYTRSGNSESRRMFIQGGNGGDGRVGIGGVTPGGGFGQTPGSLTIHGNVSTSGYNCITLVGSSTANNTNKGGNISSMAHNTSNPPYVLLGGWATSSENILYLGGGGWGSNSAESTTIRFYSGSGQGNSARATHRWNVESSGHFVPTSDNSYQVGSSNNRLNNLYTRQINFTYNTSSGNTGGANSIYGLDRYVSRNTAQSYGSNMYGQWPQKHLGRFELRGYTAGSQAGGRYLHVKINQPMSSNMMFWRAEGYLYNRGNIWARAGCYPYAPSNSILSLYINNSGNSTISTMYRASDGYLVIRFDRNSTGYSEGRFDLWLSGHGNGSYAGKDVTGIGYSDSTSFF
jgi:hypothetical protein